MFTSILILGRQPRLGMAELESLYGPERLQPVGVSAVLLDEQPGDVAFQRLGGSIKLAKVLTELPTTDFSRLLDYIQKTIPEHLGYLPEGKVKFGLSVFGIQTNVAQLNRSTLSIKKTIRQTGHSVRVVPNNELSLNSAQVRHNQLTSPLGMELLLIRNGTSTILAQTVQEQDIEAYADRDQKRPKRDARVGMLPPKLAQIIINLANPSAGSTVLDPFCGTGVILQEAILMELGAYGTDLEPKMVDYTNANLKWLEDKTEKRVTGATEVGDATSFVWKEVEFQSIACETYLGRPFSTTPPQDVLQEVMQDVDTIHRKFLRNVAEQTPSGFRMCIAVPAWKTPNGFKHLKILDSLEEFGYNRVSFVHAEQEELIYHREGQIVARELVVLIRK